MHIFPLLETLPSTDEDDTASHDDDDNAFQDSSQQASWLQDGMESHQNGGGARVIRRAHLVS